MIIDDRHPHELLQSALRRLHDISDVLAAISVAAWLVGEHIELIEADIMELARLASEREHHRHLGLVRAYDLNGR